MDFHQRLRHRREVKNLSREELSEKTGFHNRTITSWETEGREPRVSDLLVLAKALDTSVAYLVGEMEDPEIILGNNVEKDKNQTTGKVPILAPAQKAPKGGTANEAPMRFRLEPGKTLSIEQIERAKRSVEERIALLEEKERLYKLRDQLDDLQSGSSS